MRKYFLSIDNGGTNTKVVVFDSRGKQLGVSAFPTASIEEKNAFREIDLTKLWKAICCAIKDVLVQTNLTGHDIHGISCVGHGKGLYLLDKQKNVFTNGILSTDERGHNLAKEFEERSEQIWSITYQHVVSAQSPVLLRWLKDKQPETYNKIAHVLSAKDFVRFKLTNQLFQEIGDASGNNLIDLKRKDYSQEVFEFFGIAEIKDSFPPLIDYSQIGGYVTEEVEQLTGLKKGTPVVGGFFDIDACAVASGVLDNTKLNVIAGTWSINSYPSKEPASQKSGLMNSLYPGNQYLIESSSPTSAGNLNLILKMLMVDEQKNTEATGKTIYDVLEDFLTYTDAAFSKVLFFPFLYGSNSQENAQSSFIGLNDTTTKSELVRAVYEGIVFAHKKHFEILIKERKNKPEVIRISGGAVNSIQWVQMFADILVSPIETVKATEQGALGGAIAAALGTGYYSTLEEAVDNMIEVDRRVEPRLEMSELYQKKYQVYKLLLEALEDTWDDLKNMRQEMEKI